MVKIKRKVQKNLPQLIEWAWDNGIDSRTFKSPKGGDITFDEYGGVVDVYSIKPNDTFTVEVEEELTEDTEFKKLICLGVDDEYESYDNLCILDFDEDRVRAIYIPNDDLTMTLIWRDGKLVE